MSFAFSGRPSFLVRGKTAIFDGAKIGGIFNTINSSLHGAWLIVFRDTIVLDWAAYNTILGLVLFLIGMVINVDSCSRLIRLKKENPEGYSIPHGGLFRWVSCPNYFGEIIVPV